MESVRVTTVKEVLARLEDIEKSQDKRLDSIVTSQGEAAVRGAALKAEVGRLADGVEEQNGRLGRAQDDIIDIQKWQLIEETTRAVTAQAMAKAGMAKRGDIAVGTLIIGALAVATQIGIAMFTGGA